MSITALIVAIAIIVVVVLLSRWIIEQTKIPHPFDVILMILVGVGCLLLLLNQLGVVGAPVIRF